MSRFGSSIGSLGCALVAAFLVFSVAQVRADIPATLISGAMANFAVSTAPKPAPEVKFIDADGKQVTLADFRGKLVLINFWATWCAPCRREMGEFDHLQAELGGDDFVIVAISADRKGPDVIPPFYKENNITHLGVYNDKTMKTHRAFRVPGLPTTVILDHEGQIIGRLIGPAEWASDEALALIKHLIAETKAAKAPAKKAAAN